MPTYFPERYTNATPTTATVGGVVVGSTFTAQSMTQMFDALLYPYIPPTFATFSITTQDAILEVGVSLVNPRFAWTKTQTGNIATNNFVIRNTADSFDVSTTVAYTDTSYTSTYTVTNAAPTRKTFRITGTATNAASFYAACNVDWYWRSYFGESAATSLTEATIKSLRTSRLSSTSAGSYAFNAADAQFKYIVTPTTLTTFMYGTNPMPMDSPPAEVPVTNTAGATHTYYVYKTANRVGSALTITAS